VLQPSWIGRRVSVRFRAGATFTDIVGDLLALDRARAVVEGRRGLVEVPLETVAAARLAQPSTADELALERVAASGWRGAETAELGGWLLRADPAGTRRANSALPLGPPGRSLLEALDQARRWYAARGLPLLLAVPTEARRLLDAELGERGWAPSGDVAVLAARLDCVDVSAAPPDLRVTLAPEPSEGWLRCYRGGALATPAGRALLARHGAACFAAVRDGDDIVAVARAVVDDGWLGLSAVETAPQRRRRGLATAAVAALVAWAGERGAARSYAQVDTEDSDAIVFWTRLGYWEHHAYRYRTDPEAAERPTADTNALAKPTSDPTSTSA
jgi:GNAT superfamily N-acetyltransferase